MLSNHHTGLRQRFLRLTKIWADGTYRGLFVDQAAELNIDVEITTRLSDRPGFQVIPPPLGVGADFRLVRPLSPLEQRL